jgi:hypothetical protein
MTMLKHHICALLAASLLPIGLSASNVSLGAEVPVSAQVDIHAAAGLQDFVKVASNGRDFVAVWTDLRIQGWGQYADVFATRIGVDGKPADRFGRRLGPAGSTGPNPQIDSDGHDYVAVWATAGGGIRSVHLDENGAPLADAQVVAPGDWPVALVFSGSHYLLVGQKALTLLERDGTLVRAIGFNGGLSVVGASPRPDGAFAVVYRTPQPMIRTISADGPITDASVPLWPSDALTAAAFSPSAVLMVSRTTSSYALVGYDGTVIQPVTPISGLTPDDKDGVWASAAWDGHEFLAVFPPGKSVRISAAGKLLDTAPFAMSQGVVSRPAFATAGATQLAVWSDGELNAATNPELAGRAVAGFDALTTPAEATLLSYSGTAQRGLRIARSSAGVFGVWTDDRLYGAWAAFNGRQFPLQKTEVDWIDVPVVAAGAHSFLVVWRYTDLKDEDDLVAQRFDTNGNAIDAEPFEIGEDLPEFWSHQQPTVAFDSTAFLVAWTKGKTLSTVRIGESGQPFDTRQIALVTGPNVWQTYSPLALWMGSRTFVLYALQNLSPSPHFSVPSSVSGVFLDSGPSISVKQASTFPFGGFFSRFGAAIGGGAVALAWVSSANDTDQVWVSQAALDGAPLEATFHLTRPGARTADIAWTGSEFVLIWTEGTPGEKVTLRGIRLNAHLAPIDAEPFDVADDLSPYPATIIPTESGVLIGYSRVDAANGFAPRAFTRTLDRLGNSAGRRRSAR